MSELQSQDFLPLPAIEFKARRSGTGSFDPGGSFGAARPARRRFHRAATLTLALCLTGLLFSASAQASGGTVMGWGYNKYGEAGTGQVSNTGCYCIETPVSAPGLSGVSQTAGGYYHSMALSTDGTVKTWGRNQIGELGNGTTQEGNPTPTAVPGLSSVISIAAAGYNSYALLSNGTVMSWGENESGQLGIGTTTGPEECGTTPCSRHPVTVPGLSNVVAISAGGETVFALLADGTVMGWGYNEEGQMGDGVGTQTGCECVDHPVAIPGVSNAIAISAGESWAMALLADHSVIAWGESDYGQLGNGDATNFNPECDCLPATKTLTGVKSIAAGDYHGIAILLDGTVQTWGYNYYGELGNGSANKSSTCDCSATPATILSSSGAQAATANYYDGMLLLSDGTLRGWGQNEYGELGDGTLEQRLSPVPAAGVTGASAVDLRYYGGSAIIGPSQTLSVASAGAGGGTVQGGGEITCPTICSAKYPQGRVEILRAAPAAGSGFAGFSGPCTGTGNCQVTMGTDQTVTATFGVPKGTAVTKATIKKSKGKSKGKGKAKGKRTATATFSFSAPGAITGFECALIKPKPKHHKNHKPKGHKVAKRATLKKQLPHFVACASPKVYKNLKPGKYTFEVRALDILGADANPAIKTFKIRPPR